MPDMPDRRRLVVLGALAVLALLVLLVGAGFGGRDAGAGGWQERLRGLGAGGDLTTSHLVLRSGDCRVGGQQIAVRTACVLEVQPAGGRFSLGAPTRRATLENGPAPLGVTMTVEGQEIEVDLEAGEDVLLTIGRSGGTLALECEALLEDCVVRLSPA